MYAGVLSPCYLSRVNLMNNLGLCLVLTLPRGTKPGPERLSFTSIISLSLVLVYLHMARSFIHIFLVF